MGFGNYASLKVMIGPGNLDNKGVYALENIEKGEIVIKYNLQKLSKQDFNQLSYKEKMFTHVHRGNIYLYSDPERYVNHSRTILILIKI